MKNRTIHKILTALLAALLCLSPLAACVGCGKGGAAKTPGGGQFDFPGNYAQPELTVDGKDTEQEWLNAPVLAAFGRNGYAVS
ncbi:MAG: hypothetical protein LBL66_11430, partial [Clostridiales bacterium]|nr:hypothetical protein [Clostridiales bacterium]